MCGANASDKNMWMAAILSVIDDLKPSASAAIDTGAVMLHTLTGNERDLRIGIITWNMGNAPPSDVRLLFPNKCRDFDFVVVGLQESTYTMSADNVNSTGVLQGVAAVF